MRSRCDFNPLCAIIAPPGPPAEEEGESFKSLYPRPGVPALAGVATLVVAPDWLRPTPGAGPGCAFPWTRKLRGIHESDVRPREDGRREETTEEEVEEEVRIVLYPCSILSPFYRSPQHVDNNARVRVRVYAPRKSSTCLSDGASTLRPLYV